MAFAGCGIWKAHRTAEADWWSPASPKCTGPGSRYLLLEERKCKFCFVASLSVHLCVKVCCCSSFFMDIFLYRPVIMRLASFDRILWVGEFSYVLAFLDPDSGQGLQSEMGGIRAAVRTKPNQTKLFLYIRCICEQMRQQRDIILMSCVCAIT